jgi:hypothetical protein
MPEEKSNEAIPLLGNLIWRCCLAGVAWGGAAGRGWSAGDLIWPGVELLDVDGAAGVVILLVFHLVGTFP